MPLLKLIVNGAWEWFKGNIKLPFGLSELKDQSMDVAFNQGLPALIRSLESAVPAKDRHKLNHGMWQAVKQAAQSNDANSFLSQASTALQNSGQADEILKVVNGAQSAGFSDQAGLF